MSLNKYLLIIIAFIIKLFTKSNCDTFYGYVLTCAYRFLSFAFPDALITSIMLIMIYVY